MNSNGMALRLLGMLLLALLIVAPAGLASGQEEQLPEEGQTAEDQASEEPASEEPTAEEPASEEPTAEEPVAEEPTAEEPVAEEPTAEEPASEEPAAEVAEEEQPVKLIKMFAEEWKWSPKLIRVPQGTKLRIEFLSYGATRKFVLKAYKLNVLIQQDKLASVEFVADKKGTFRWKCGRPCGNGCAKMTGKLIVE